MVDAPLYPRLTTRLPPHLHARIQAAATVLERPIDELVEEALEDLLAGLEPSQRELVDRIAASLIQTTEPD